MTIILSQIQMNNLQAILDDTNLTEKQRTTSFYTELDNLGIDYGRLGLGITQNNTWQGQIANGFAEAGGDDNPEASYNFTTERRVA